VGIIYSELGRDSLSNVGFTFNFLFYYSVSCNGCVYIGGNGMKPDDWDKVVVVVSVVIAVLLITGLI
jgi:hypothetical protein